jgi:cation:H+ antiporter
VEGAASTAVMFAVRPVIIGLTIVSLATSAPELLVSLVAAVKGSGGISIGNILGSNVINIALVLGISAVIRPVAIKRQVVMIEIPYMIFVSIVFWVLCMDSQITRTDGIILIVFLFIFLVYGFLTAKD